MNKINKNTLQEVISFAKWAPSGDNIQPWRFQVTNHNSIKIVFEDTEYKDVYDLNLYASKIAIGALQETMTLAASKFGLEVKFVLLDEDKLIYEASFVDKKIEESELLKYVKNRTTQRRSMKTDMISKELKNELKEVLDEGFSYKLFETLHDKIQIAKLNFKNAEVRLNAKEAYEVHKNIIEWNSRFSKTKIPDQALGADKVTTKLMKWVLSDYSRVKFMNKYMMGTLLPKIQLDFIPGLLCAGHFAIVYNGKLEETNKIVQAGRNVMRFWLTLQKYSVYMQPSMTPVIFSKYNDDNIKFFEDEKYQTMSKNNSALLKNIVKLSKDDSIVFMGRIGYSKQPVSRSIRRDNNDLMIEEG